MNEDIIEKEMREMRRKLEKTDLGFILGVIFPITLAIVMCRGAYTVQRKLLHDEYLAGFKAGMAQGQEIISDNRMCPLP